MINIKEWSFWQQFNRLFVLVILLSLIGMITQNDVFSILGRLIWFGVFALYPKVPDSVSIYQKNHFKIFIRYASIIIFILTVYSWLT